MTTRTGRNACRSAFTLIELMVVILIIALLAAIVIPNVLHNVAEGRHTAALAQVKNIDHAVRGFFLDNGRCPLSLTDLTTRPAGIKVWPKDGYLDSIPKDPWGNEYQYLYPGPSGKTFDVFSYGDDGAPGGEDFAADITNHDSK